MTFWYISYRKILVKIYTEWGLALLCFILFIVTSYVIYLNEVNSHKITDLIPALSLFLSFGPFSAPLLMLIFSIIQNKQDEYNIIIKYEQG